MVSVLSGPLTESSHHIDVVKIIGVKGILGFRLLLT